MKHAKRLVAMLLVLATVLTTCVSAFAATAKSNSKYDYNGDGKVVYTSFGDSIPGGFGLPDYNKYKTPLVYGKEISGSYPSLLADKLGVDKLNFMAIPGTRSEDVAYLIGAKKYEDWISNEYPDISGRTLSTDDLEDLKPSYIKAMKEADIITLDVGFNDMWEPTILCIYTIAQEGGIFNTDMDMQERIAEYGSTIVVLQNVVRYFNAWIVRPDHWAKFMTLWVSTLTKFMSDYTINMQRICATIAKENPDAHVVLSGRFNPFKGWGITPFIADNGFEVLTNWFFDIYSTQAQFLAWKYDYEYIDVADVETACEYLTTIPLYPYMSTTGGFLKFNPHPTLKGHKQIADRMYAVLK